MLRPYQNPTGDWHWNSDVSVEQRVACAKWIDQLTDDEIKLLELMLTDSWHAGEECGNDPIE